ncbi:DUF6069 family protein [Amycolatopsis thailandensis]|uniref:DUF6069 family protein n=1 Tax=Amycolatopsis thailandensis TaxID=589330 RepID=UPI003649F1EF
MILARTLGVAGATAAAALVWVLGLLLDADVETVRKSGETVDLPLLYVVVVALLSGIGGWAALALLERFAGARALPLWYSLATAVLLVALVHTALETQLSGGQRLWLGGLCVAVAVVLVTTLPRRA